MNNALKCTLEYQRCVFLFLQEAAGPFLRSEQPRMVEAEPVEADEGVRSPVYGCTLPMTF